MSKPPERAAFSNQVRNECRARHPLCLPRCPASAGPAFFVRRTGQARAWSRFRSLDFGGFVASDGAPRRIGAGSQRAPCSNGTGRDRTGRRRRTCNNCRAGKPVDHECPGQHGLGGNCQTTGCGQTSQTKNRRQASPRPHRRRGERATDASGCLSTAFMVRIVDQ
jgi:hypothetical protein